MGSALRHPVRRASISLHLVRVHDVRAMKPVVEVCDEIARYQA
jgi:dihydropteroate synthase